MKIMLVWARETPACASIAFLPGWCVTELEYADDVLLLSGDAAKLLFALTCEHAWGCNIKV